MLSSMTAKLIIEKIEVDLLYFLWEMINDIVEMFNTDIPFDFFRKYYIFIFKMFKQMIIG